MYAMVDQVLNTCYGLGVLMEKEVLPSSWSLATRQYITQALVGLVQRAVPVEAQLAGVGKPEVKTCAKVVMAETLAYWLVDAVADELMSPAFNKFWPIIIKAVKFAKDFLSGALAFLTQINTIGGLANAGFLMAGGDGCKALTDVLRFQM